MSAPSSPKPPRPSQTAPAVLSLAGLVVGLVAGLLTWFTIAGTNVSLLTDSYHAMYVYGTQGASALRDSGVLGSTLFASATTNAVVLVSFAIVLFFWPAMLVSGVVNSVLRSYGPYPFVWGLITFVFAYVFVYYVSSASLGIGAYLDLIAALIFLAATIAVRRPAAAPAPPAAAPPSAAGAPPSS